MIKTGVSKVFGSNNLVGAARKAMQRRGNTTSISALKMFGVAGAVTAGYAVGRVVGARHLGQFRRGLIKGLYPGSAMPMESGRFGVRTTSTPAGIGGLRFNFRRR